MSDPEETNFDDSGESTLQVIAQRMSAMVAPGANMMYANISLKGDDNYFVQFVSLPERSACGKFDKGTVIWIDLPCQVMNEEQNERARKLFGELGADCPIEEHCVNEDDKPFMMVTWRANVGNDPERAARTGLRFLDEIFQPPKGSRILFWCEEAE